MIHDKPDFLKVEMFDKLRWKEINTEEKNFLSQETIQQESVQTS
ncbi:thymosin beta-15A-like [Peromyscus eremicus]|nr:thymosin beta-15A-like [Peromyscus eremicus]